MSAAKSHNQITGPNAGGPRQFPIRTSLAARVGQFCRSTTRAMFLHRIIRLVCLFGAIAAPMLAAFLCRFTSRIAIKHVIPHSGSDHLPWLTQTWVAGAADGSFPLIPIALVVSALVATSGFYVHFSKRLSADAVATAYAIIWCVAYAAAVVSVGSTMMALVLPFLSMATG